MKTDSFQGENLYTKCYDFILFNPELTDHEKVLLTAFLFYFNPDLKYKNYSVNYQLLSTSLNCSTSIIRRRLKSIENKLSDKLNIPIKIFRNKHEKSNEVFLEFSMKVTETLEVQYSGIIKDQDKYKLSTSTILLLLNRQITQYESPINSTHIFNLPEETILKALSVYEFYNRKQPIENNKEERQAQMFQYKKLFLDSLRKGYYKDYLPYDHSKDIDKNKLTEYEAKTILSKNLSLCFDVTISNEDKARKFLYRNSKYRLLHGIVDETFYEINQKLLIETICAVQNNRNILQQFFKNPKTKHNEKQSGKVTSNRIEQLHRAGRSITTLGNT